MKSYIFDHAEVVKHKSIEKVIILLLIRNNGDIMDCTMADWKRYIPWVSEKTIKRLLKELARDKYIEILNKNYKIRFCECKERGLIERGNESEKLFLAQMKNKKNIQNFADQVGFNEETKK